MCCDWWTLGVLIYEFLSGCPPFYDENQYRVYEKILSAKIEWPRYFDSTAKDLIKKLLVTDPTKRLGSGNCGTVSGGKFREKKFGLFKFVCVKQFELKPVWSSGSVHI